MTVILASKSPARAALLQGAGVPFETVSPRVDELSAKASLIAEGATPREVADALAELKAVRAARSHAALVIGADQTLELDSRLIDKADDLAGVRETLLALRGKVHRLHSAVVVAREGVPIWRDLKTATLSVRPFTDVWLDDYLEREGQAALGAVGCYRLEGPGLQLFDRIDGDYFTILGLPMLGLLDFLRLHGVLLP
jgi:septum formation protein